MATQSIMKNIVIRDEKAAIAFEEALEKAALSQKQATFPNYTVNELKGEQIRRFFGEE